MLKNITNKIPLNTISRVGLNSAEIALNYAQGGTSSTPIRFIAGYNLDYVIKIEHKIDNFHIIYHTGTSACNDILCKGSEQYDEIHTYLQSQTMTEPGEIVKILNQLKTSTGNE